ncbi:PTS sugar transporter subunit IIA [Cellulomonas bogoriensis]|uniref:PTS sugar transporter subunit IIA n=1 Tax=Cellulomonas bogoriensis TaxID=301388 RepID=UPI0022B54F68|nr:PTS glucose transporter subunit IIA [Cellulomonas bogoriensis]
MSPVDGRVLLPGEVPDQVFAQELLGPGAAVDPGSSGPGTVLAPISGTVVSLHPHAFVVQGEGLAVLVHAGIDTVTCKGEGFTTLVTAGEEVSGGDPVLTWMPADVTARGLSTVCPVVVLEGQAEEVGVLTGAGGVVRAGEPLLRVVPGGV